MKDTEEALRRLEQELLAEEPPELPDDLLPDAELPVEYEETDPDAYLYCDAPEGTPQRRSLTGLAIATGLLTAGIVGAVAWWVTRSLS